MSFRLEVLQESVKWAETLYDAANKLSARLEDKAQQSATMAGLFLAAAFGFLKPDNGALVGSHRLVATLLTFTVVIFLLCLAACLSVTWLRPAPMPLNLQVLRTLNEDLLQFPEDKMTEAMKENYLRDRLSVWAGILDNRAAVNRDKAFRLKIAQALLAIGMLTVGILLFFVIHSILISS
jgi:hypothetical protein